MKVMSSSGRDDGNEVETDACLNDCTAASCGDGKSPSRVEGCDDGNVDPGDGCDRLCRLESCGNRRVDAGGMRRRQPRQHRRVPRHLPLGALRRRRRADRHPRW